MPSTFAKVPRDLKCTQTSQKQNTGLPVSTANAEMMARQGLVRGHLPSPRDGEAGHLGGGGYQRAVEEAPRASRHQEVT